MEAQGPDFRQTLLPRVSCRAVGLAGLAACLAFAPSLRAQDANLARLTYVKILKGSVPEYLAITVDEKGAGTYEGRQLSDSPNPHTLKLSPTTAGQLFRLAAELNDFKGIDLESHKKVANLGEKTLTYQKGSEKYSAQFNYTMNREAAQLADLFERIGTVEQHIQALEFAMKYDHLSLPGELLQIQIDLEKKALADPELMIPALEQIARNPRFLHLAQVRAQDILQRVQNSN